MKKVLIAYYSWSGTTAKLAHLLQQVTGGDLYEMKVAADVFSSDMYATSDIATKQRATNALPQLVGSLPDLNQYDVVLIGGPVWSGALATPVLTFLQQGQSTKAVLAPFYTDAGTKGDYEKDFTQAAGQPVKPGIGMDSMTLNQATAIAKVKAWWQQNF